MAPLPRTHPLQQVAQDRKELASAIPPRQPPQSMVDELAHVRTAKLLEIADTMKALDSRWDKREAEIPVGLRGTFKVTHPECMTLNEIEDCEQFLALLFKRMRRNVGRAESADNILSKLKPENE